MGLGGRNLFLGLVMVAETGFADGTVRPQRKIGFAEKDCGEVAFGLDRFGLGRVASEVLLSGDIGVLLKPLCRRWRLGLDARSADLRQVRYGGEKWVGRCLF